MATLAFNELRFFNSFKKGGLYNIEISKPCKAKPAKQINGLLYI